MAIERLGKDNIDPETTRRLRLIRTMTWEEFVEMIKGSLAESMKPMWVMERNLYNKRYGDPGYDPKDDSPIMHRVYPNEACDELMRRTTEMETTTDKRKLNPCGCLFGVIIISIVIGSLITYWIMGGIQ